VRSSEIRRQRIALPTGAPQRKRHELVSPIVHRKKPRGPESVATSPQRVRMPTQGVVGCGYWPAWTGAGAQKRSKARVRSCAIEEESRPSMSHLSSMKATFPSCIKAIEGEDGR
jgi:hypothetical protein